MTTRRNIRAVLVVVTALLFVLLFPPLARHAAPMPSPESLDPPAPFTSVVRAFRDAIRSR